MRGLGALYSGVASYLFADWNKCGEVMGLAPYGRAGAMKPLLRMENGELEIPERGAEFNKPYLVDTEGDWEKSASMRHWEDCAWQVQDATGKVLLELGISLRATPGATTAGRRGAGATTCA